MPHIVSLPVGYMVILEKKFRSVILRLQWKRWRLLFLQKMVITPATKMMTLETMITMPWWRASRTRPGETILIPHIGCVISQGVFLKFCLNLLLSLFFGTHVENIHLECENPVKIYTRHLFRSFTFTPQLISP